MDVRMPDGTVIRNVPEGTTKSELQRRLQKMEPSQSVADQPPVAPSFGQAAGRAAIERFLGNLGSVPAVLGNPVIDALTPRPMGEGQVIPNPLQAGSAAIRALTGGRIDPTASAERVRAQGGTIPRIEGTDIMAAGQTVGDLIAPGGGMVKPGEVFAGHREQQETLSQRFQEQAPFATGVGEVAGDAATLLAGRLPFSRVGRLPPAPGSSSTLTPGARRLFERVVNSQAVRKVIRGAGRSAETGLEGAALAILNDNDPVEVAAFGAGGQMAGSMMLTAGEGLISGGPLKAGAKIALAAGAVTGLVQLGKSAIPGGQDRILESIETGFDKVKWALVAGMLSGLAGAGRLRTGSGEMRDRFAEDLPKVAEFITTLPRGAVLSFINEWTSSNPATQQEIEVIYGRLAEDPDYFGKAEARRLNRALTDSRVSVKRTVDDLMKRRTFREKLDSLYVDGQPVVPGQGVPGEAQ